MDTHTVGDVARSPALVRRRNAFACVSCRTKKIRCDGQEQCEACRTLGIDCHYNHENTPTKGKSDLILNSILRLEQSISSIDLNVTALRQDVSSIMHQPVVHHVSPHSGRTFPALSEGRDDNHEVRTTSFSGRSSGNDATLDEFSNATISSHTSTTEAILHWPVFDSFPELRQEDVLKSGSVFRMESARTRSIQANPIVHLLSETELDRLVDAFSMSINFSYPIVSQRSINYLKYHYSTGDLDHSTKTCLILLILALGCAAEMVAIADEPAEVGEHRLMRFRMLGRVYFDGAMSRLHTAYCSTSAESIQCLALTALYFAYLQRPIQAWSMLSSTATACRVNLSYSMLNADDMECVRRVFWMCFILESDYLAELPALPRFGIADVESNVPLPGRFDSHEHAESNDLSSLYFLACISMRRLLNRCHHLLFGQQQTQDKGSQRLSAIVSELNQQLEDWKTLLPPAFHFSTNTEPVHSQHGAFLRQRYLTCRALIHRPHLIKATADHAASRHSDSSTIYGAEQCLISSVLHILNLRPFRQTVLVDMWICSLSMAGTMMILLAASKTAVLSRCIASDIYVVGPHLISLLEKWAGVHGDDRSPSVQQATQWIKIIDNIVQSS